MVPEILKTAALNDSDNDVTQHYVHTVFVFHNFPGELLLFP
jgi:hypothetical protein